MITVVVPIFNLMEYLPKCMTTLLKQCGSFEIILIDDGSTDGSSVLCDYYASEFPDRVRVIHKKNGGLSSARNIGINFAQGEYIIFPDPDDWVEPNYISRLIELQEKYKPDLLCVGYYVDYDDHLDASNIGYTFRQMDSQQAQKALFTSPSMGGFAWNKLYHLDIIRDNNLQFMNDVGTTEDLDFVFRYLNFCKNVIFLPEERLYHYYQRAGGATHSTFNLNKFDAIHTYEKILETAKDKELIKITQEEICNFAINLFWLYEISNYDDEHIKKKIQNYIKKYLFQYCLSKKFGTNRKIQGILACYVPILYIYMKKKIQKGC